LRAVRLLPDVVKIGVEPETALPSDSEEEQISHEESSDGIPADENFSNEKSVSKGRDSKTSEKNSPVSVGKAAGETAALNVSDSQGPEVKNKKKKEFQKENTKENVKESTKENTKENTFADPLGKANDRILELEAQLKTANAAKQSLGSKIAALEAELAGAKKTFAQKEQELSAGVKAAREQARTEGRTQGHEEGLKSGYDTGLGKARTEIENQYREKFSKLVATLEGISTRLEENFAELVSLNEPRMLRLWQGMLLRMLRHETRLFPEGLLKVLSDILSRLSDKNQIVIYVSPQDMTLLKERLTGEFGDVLRSVKHLELKPDASVDKGSCLVETNLGVYDARWSTQLEQIDSVIEGLFQKLGRPPIDETATDKPKAANG
jgi:flagellar assembly protein FliH